MKENIYLAYWINPDDSTFQTVNFSEMTKGKENIPFLDDIEKIRRIFHDVDSQTIYVDLIGNDEFSVIVFSLDEQYLPINKNIYSLIENSSLRTRKNEIEQYFEEIFSDTVDSELQSILSEMHQELANYSSFISIFDFETDNLLASTLHKKKDENLLAKEVFVELKRLDLIKKIDLEVELKKIGPNVQVFYFYVKGLVYVIYCINIQVNTGIIRLKLKTFLKNKMPNLRNIRAQTKEPISSVKIVEPDLSDSNIKHFKLDVRF